MISALLSIPVHYRFCFDELTAIFPTMSGAYAIDSVVGFVWADGFHRARSQLRLNRRSRRTQRIPGYARLSDQALRRRRLLADHRRNRAAASRRASRPAQILNRPMEAGRTIAALDAGGTGRPQSVGRKL